MSAARARVAPQLQRAADALSAPPEPHWMSHAMHHGARVLVLLAAAVAVFFFFPAPRVPDSAVLERGVVAPHDVIAEFDFTIPKSEAELLRDQADAASGVPLVFDDIGAAPDSMLAGINGLLTQVASAAGEADDRRAAVRATLERYRVTPTPGAVDLLLDARRRSALARSVSVAVRALYPRGVLPASLPRENFSAARVRGPDGAERLVPRDSLLTPDRFFDLAVQRLPESAGADAGELERLLLIRFFQPGLVYNEGETEAARARARAAVDPAKARVLQGEKIVGAREQISEHEEARLRAYREALRAREPVAEGEHAWPRTLGAILYNSFLLGIFGALLLLYRPALYQSFRAVLLFALLAVGVTGAAALIAHFSLPPELIPVTFAALIIAALWDGWLALSLALLLALLLGGQTPFLGASVPFTVAVGGAAAALSVKIVQRRSKTWLFISLISLAYAAAAVTMGLLRSREAFDVASAMGFGVLNAIVASLLAIGFLPLIESFTRVTTDQTLLELSDLNGKLLKRLAMEASGTYHHTINVANLAEAAAHAIGANGLLARVGAYYHDIGKLVKPQYFIENQPRGRNPHDKLKPAMSAAIIRSHVVEGLKLASEAKLPPIVRAFIVEHHGTQPISYFLEKARELDPDGTINPADFAYTGPKPQSRETAIVMMADSIESAARVLHDPSPERLRELVDRLVASKMSSGQLDQCPLTLREIEIVKEHLVIVLAGMYHHRIDYPTPPDSEPLVPPPLAAAASR
jgi:putative nucleotidyltransferase with HDIG domain